MEKNVSSGLNLRHLKFIHISLLTRLFSLISILMTCESREAVYLDYGPFLHPRWYKRVFKTEN